MRSVAALAAVAAVAALLAGCAADAPATAPGGFAATPVRLRIPAIGVDSGLERLVVSRHGRLRPPVDPDRAGWFAASAPPGDLGAAVVAGHRDSRTGPAVFARLSDLHRGDRIAVTRSDGSTARFRVVEVRRVSRARFPTDAIYGAVPDRALRLITCGGLYDHLHGRYRANVVVLALAF